MLRMQSIRLAPPPPKKTNLFFNYTTPTQNMQVLFCVIFLTEMRNRLQISVEIFPRVMYNIIGKKSAGSRMARGASDIRRGAERPAPAASVSVAASKRSDHAAGVKRESAQARSAAADRPARRPRRRAVIACRSWRHARDCTSERLSTIKQLRPR